MLGYSGGQDRDVTTAFAVGFHVSTDCIDIGVAALFITWISQLSELLRPAKED